MNPAHRLSTRADTAWGSVRITAIADHSLSPKTRQDLVAAIQQAMQASAGKPFDFMGEVVQEAMSNVRGTHFTTITIERSVLVAAPVDGL